MKIKRFNKLTEEDYQILSNIDESIVHKYGSSFSDEIWSIKNFKYILPQKDNLSFACLVNNKIIGYIVASFKSESVYIHRFTISKKGYGKIFLEEVLKNYNNKSIYLMVNIVNIIAIEFYKNFDFIIIDKEDIIKKFIADGLKIKNSKILVGENYKCYLMKRN